MIARTRELVALMRPYARRFPWLVSATISFGILSSLAEGVGVTLFIPLLGGLAALPVEAGGPLVTAVHALFARVDPAHRLEWVALCILLAISLRSLLAYAVSVAYATLDARVGHLMRSGVLSQCLQVDYPYWERLGWERMFNVLTSETWRASRAVGTLLSLVSTLATLGIYALALLLISWQLTSLVVLALLAFSWLSRVLTRQMVVLSRLATRANARLAKRMIEAFQGMGVIRAFAREASEQARFDHASRRVSRFFWRSSVVSALVGPTLELGAGVLVVALLMSYSFFTDNLPAVLVFLLILVRLQPRVRELNDRLVTLDGLRAPVQEVEALLSRDDKPYPSSGGQPCAQIRAGIRLERVSFRYPEAERLALDDVSAAFPFGCTTAVVGPSGSGKSTLVKLLLRFYDPCAGEVYLDAQPLRAFHLPSVRRRMALVSQDVYLFDASVRQNIAYADPGAPLSAVIEAAKQAGAHDFISALPDGYETRLGSRGVKLSGGQQQRLTLARAILARPDLLILDEATNALDSITEDVVQSALDAMQGSCAIVIVAHRLASIERADQVLVLDHGRVAERGAYAALLRRGGLFTRLYQLQFRQPLQTS